MPFSLGIVGAGNISGTHARAALEIPGVGVTAAVGRDAGKVGAFAQRFGAKAYTDYDAFLRHEPLDVVLLGSPSGMHAEQGIRAARAGKHVLSEKPLDVSTRNVDSLIAACEENGVKLGVFFQDRAAPDLVWLQRLIAKGELGDPILASARVKWYRSPEYYGSSSWRATWALDGGGAVMNQGVHTIDLLLWLFGDVARISARTRTSLHSIETEDTAVASLEFENGALGTFEATTAAYPGYARRVELTGSNGTVIVEGDRVVSVDLKDPPGEPPPRSEASTNPSATSATVSDVSGHRRVLEDFLAAIESDSTPRCDGREGRRSVALVEGLYQSARSGEMVEIGRNPAS